ncbi:MAG: hypothetical protein QOI37_502 [Chloroflexota bacterium]|jgi:hypothetical protein|nr:hypothetical protein [Chloroflexota bacterium]
MRLARAVRSRAAASGVTIALLVTACGGSTPSGRITGPVTSPVASTAGTSATIPASGAAAGLIDFTGAETADPAAAAHRELELVRQVRDDAGMPALIGQSGPAAFAALDVIEAAFGKGVLEDASTAIASRRTPPLGAADPLAGQVASLDARPAPGRIVAGAIDVSLFADTGFTANAIMGLYAGLVERAAENQSGTLPKSEHFDKTADGLRQVVDLRTTITVRTGGGRVQADITMTATDNISDATTGSFVGLYTSTAHGHFDVNACPDANGLGVGTYTFETKHELNDVSGASTSRAGGGRKVDAPFKLIDGDDAHLQRIEATLDLAADAHGPGSAGGPGPTGPFDWGASQQLQLVMPAGGGTTGSGAAPTVSGSGGRSASGALFFSSAMAQLFLAEVGKAAQTFWRSGKCIELKPSDDTRKVQPNEQIDLTVEARHAFSADEIKAPIVAKFSGMQSVAPVDQPIDPPAKFTFKAGGHQDDKGTIDLTQTSRRGIGLRQIVFTVNATPLVASIDSTLHVDLAGNVYDTTIHLAPIDLAPAADGSSRGEGTVHTTTTFTPAAGCNPVTYTGTFQSQVSARIDPVDPTKALVRVGFTPGPVKTEHIVCGGRSQAFPGTTFLGSWAALSTREIPVAIDGSAHVDSAIPGGTSKITITIKRKPPVP